ncbi:MAG: hypothetical protein ACE5EC_10480 [Phycisphaerae bacterium]
MKRIGTILIAVWALLLMPALCTAGVLLHACECGAETGCSHETDCSDDPCGTLVTSGRTQRMLVEFMPATLPSPVCCASSDDPDHASDQFRMEERQPLPCPHLPFPMSDIPLLV